MYSIIKNIYSEIRIFFAERRCIICAKPFLPKYFDKKVLLQSHNEKPSQKNILTVIHNLCVQHMYSHLCEECAFPYQNSRDILNKHQPYCKACGEIFHHDKSQYTEQELCANCTQKKPEWANFYFINVYEGMLRTLILKAKFHNSSVALSFLGKLLAYRWCLHIFEENENSNFSLPNMIIPIPLHTIRLKERGYNQSILLAKYFLKECKYIFKIVSKNNRAFPIINTSSLIRAHYTQAQSELSQKERAQNVKNVFYVAHKNEVKNQHILLIDDIATTNATLQEASHVLLKAGARQVDILVVAKTPR